jgi:putative heme-binding domain-containing protein
VRNQTDELSALFGDEEVLKENRALLADSNASLPARHRALQLLKRVRDRKAAPVYVQLLDDDRLRLEAIELLPGTADAAAAAKLLDIFAALNNSEKTAALNMLTSRADFAKLLLEAVEGSSFDTQHLSALQIRRMSNMGDAEINRRLENVWGKVDDSSADAKAAVERIKKVFSTAPLWAFDHERGRKVYERTCAVCHPLDGSTTPLGPSLVGSWRNGIDYFLENIVDPNAVVGAGFRTTVVVTSSGTVVSGMLDSETPTSVVIRTAEKQTVVPKDEIESRQLTDQSIMPTAILDTLSEVETIELLKFLTTEQE